LLGDGADEVHLNWDKDEWYNHENFIVKSRSEHDPALQIFLLDIETIQ